MIRFVLQDKEENEETMADKTVWKPLSTPLPDDAPTRIRVDWQELSEKNDDLAAWILIPAVDISYPVLQGEDNEYYLHRDINQEYLFAGSIFMDAYNNASAIGSCKTLIPLRITNWSAATAMWDTPGSILQNTVTGFLRRHGVIT